MKKNKPPYLIRRLKIAKQKAIENASNAKGIDPSKWARWELRKEYLEREINRFTRLAHGSNLPKRVFISFTKKTGHEYHDILKQGLEKKGFKCTNGFQPNKEPSGIIVRSVLSEMKNSSVYVGIYTKEHSLSINGESSFTPSVWTIEEKGMALGLSMPVMLVCEEGIHDNFFAKTTGAFQHIVVKNIHHFQHDMLERTVDLIINKYYDNLEKYGEDETFEV